MISTTHHVQLTTADLEGWELPVYNKPAPRSPGLHVSSLIRSIAMRTGILKGETVKVGRRSETLTEGGPDPTLLAMGLAWECWAAGLHPGMVWQPPEVRCDDISMSADGITLAPGGCHPTEGTHFTVEEFKFTRKSSYVEGSARPIEGEWMWLAQVKAYCHGWDTDQARMHVLYVNGNYRFGASEGGPQYTRYDLEFTARDLSDNWALMVKEKERILALEAEDDVPF